MADSEAARFLKKSPTRNRRNLCKNQATALFEQSTLSSVLILVPVILVLLAPAMVFAYHKLLQLLPRMSEQQPAERCNRKGDKRFLTRNEQEQGKTVMRTISIMRAPALVNIRGCC